MNAIYAELMASAATAAPGEALAAGDAGDLIPWHGRLALSFIPINRGRDHGRAARATSPSFAHVESRPRGLKRAPPSRRQSHPLQFARA